MTENEVIRKLRMYVLSRLGWNRTKAAEVLGISVRSLRSSLVAYRSAGHLIEQIARGYRIEKEQIEALQKQLDEMEFGHGK